MSLQLARDKAGDLILDGAYEGWVLVPLSKADAEGARLVGLIDDDNASYDFDDFALLKAGENYYLVGASGCSCPSHEETARLEKGPCRLSEIAEHVRSGEYEGYTLPKKQAEQFEQLLKFAKTGERP